MEQIPFWKTDEGKILSYGVHEFVGATSLIGAVITLITKYPDQFTKEEIIEKLKPLKDRDLKRANDAIDYIYKEMRKLKGYD